MADRIRVTSLMRGSITAPGVTCQRRGGITAFSSRPEGGYPLGPAAIDPQGASSPRVPYPCPRWSFLQITSPPGGGGEGVAVLLKRRSRGPFPDRKAVTKP